MAGSLPLLYPPLVSKVGSRYVPEVLFDRYAIYVRTTPGQAWRANDGYFSNKLWSKVEPRSLDPSSEPMHAAKSTAAIRKVDPAKMARTSQPNPAAAPFLDLEEIPQDAAVWQMPLSVGAQSGQ